MDTLLDARFVSVSEADGALVIGFADREFDTSHYLMLQRSLDPADDDGVYLERDDEQFSSYGTVESCMLKRDQIELVLEPALAAALDTPASLAVLFACSHATFEALRAALHRLFAGTTCKLRVC